MSPRDLPHWYIEVMTELDVCGHITFYVDALHSRPYRLRHAKVSHYSRAEDECLIASWGVLGERELVMHA